MKEKKERQTARSAHPKVTKVETVSGGKHFTKFKFQL